MDEGCSRAVREVFVRLYEKGLIYQGNRIINWCPDCQTALSDAEVEYEEQASHIWHLRYPLSDGSGEIVVATTRPETMLGDTAVAVHPDDPRYTEMVGKTVDLPLTGRQIPIVADTYVERDFGSGAVKITPAHDPNDYELALRHNLPMINILTEDGHLNRQAGEAFDGLTAQEGREKVLAMLEEQGLLLRTEDYSHNVGTCYRCHATVEPLISKQWFVKMKPLAEPAIAAVRQGQTRFVPERYAKVYFNWMENIRDWCISRQLWWGHRIPAWYCQDCGETIVAREDPVVCPKCGSHKLHQDEDVLDTWFSSALWPFSTLGWPDKTEDLKYFYPTNVLVTAYDIIFFWVARMIFSGIEHTGEVPFADVLIHGIVRDSQGRKMSKSLGNGKDPLEIIEQYGADALRFALTQGISPGNDMRFSEEKVEAARNFANKIWNASRFVLMGVGDEEVPALDEVDLAPVDKWILSRLGHVVEEVTSHMDEYDLGLALGKIYDFIWSEYCDWYIEWSKGRLYGDNEEDKRAAQATLVHVLSSALRLLHPFMPFVTEKIWQYLPGCEGSIMMADWPKEDMGWRFEAEEKGIGQMMDLIRAVRNIRAEMKVPVGRKSRLLVVTEDAYAPLVTENAASIERLASASAVERVERSAVPKGAVSAVSDAMEVFLPMEDLVDLEKERARLAKEAQKLEADIARSQGKLNNPGFVGKAPEAVVAKERELMAANEAKLARVRQQIETLEG